MSQQVFTAQATSDWITYSYVNTQDRLIVANNGISDIQIEVGVFTNVTLHGQQTFDNRVDFTEFRIKGSGEFTATIIDDEVDIDELNYKTVNISATGNLLDGTVTSVLDNTLTDSTATWTVDQWKDKVVRLVDAVDAEDFCIVASNTSDTLTLDCDTSLVAVTYEILDTYYANEPKTIYALDIRTSSMGLVMPSVSERKDRTLYKVYNEMANNGDFKGVVIFRGADRGRAVKWFSLDHRFEGVDLYAHYWVFPHWDILNVDAVKRYASVRVNTSLPVTSTTFATINTFASINHLQAKRFIPVNRIGIYWLKFKSIITSSMLLTGALSVQKDGGGAASFVEVTIRLNRGGVITDLEDLAIIVRLPVNDIKAVPMSIPIELQKDDEITLIAKRDSGTINILDGSSITITEI